MYIQRDKLIIIVNMAIDCAKLYRCSFRTELQAYYAVKKKSNTNEKQFTQYFLTYHMKNTKSMMCEPMPS